MKKQTFQVHYADQRTSIVMKADLDAGWKKLQKTFGFFDQTRIPYKNDLVIRAQLTLIAQPGSFAEWTQVFPTGDFSYGDSKLRYDVCNKQLTLTLAMTHDQPWRTTEQGRPEIFVEQLHFLDVDAAHWYDLRAWVVFHGPSRKPIPDVRVWAEKNIVPGGQFESNRRRH